MGQYRKGEDMRYLLLPLSCAVAGCGTSTVPVSGYLAQVGRVGVFSADARFTDWAMVEDGPDTYRNFARKSWQAGAQGRCGLSLWRIAGTGQRKGRGVKLVTITAFSRIDRDQANQIARKSAHPTLMTVDFC
ncbi:hypothetical protein SBA_ch1_07410 [Sphingomonas bisphenolicum]|uniref:Lipoprotein n=2 Tax=Sphingomonadaceae TaxID=41297 RepID=A0ABM7G001_9SPHN|nr:hypothetical protein SBA_ch1_07410 [Sphingomonas bisphenolicum]